MCQHILPQVSIDEGDPLRRFPIPPDAWDSSLIHEVIKPEPFQMNLVGQTHRLFGA